MLWLSFSLHYLLFPSYTIWNITSCLPASLIVFTHAQWWDWRKSALVTNYYVISENIFYSLFFMSFFYFLCRNWWWLFIAEHCQTDWEPQSSWKGNTTRMISHRSDTAFKFPLTADSENVIKKSGCALWAVIKQQLLSCNNFKLASSTRNYWKSFWLIFQFELKVSMQPDTQWDRAQLYWSQTAFLVLHSIEGM